ncbi:N-acetylmuramoyl-L-alanine amidase [Pseudooceanicola nanhaiensis]|uniref:N-acetylmuramoyl-L-alanine amidase n=1 Tax=Pseudooceanicola nanhaiensis TaxID=375761 RepID=UPI001CD6E902|nr:N-acetylmuramoyl-L-alanine amidase [Pseudooceanicola nanhaiensis]MCA0918893.1 N-acetylmuramoyl-L-alanine amidase [Pseudooceanicola nanhaiensis]
MSRTLGALFVALAALFLCTPQSRAQQQDFSALARVDLSGSQIIDDGEGIRLELKLSQGVPYRVYTLTNPPRAVIDFREVDWDGVAKVNLLNSDRVTDLRFGPFRPGWSRLVMDLAGPYALYRVGTTIDTASGEAKLTARFTPTDDETYAARSGLPMDPAWDLPEPSLAAPEPRGDGPVTIVLDPGHGGIDPGAERGGLNEKTLMLTFARELKETLLRSGNTTVLLTRNDDSFVSLERRVAIAHQANADLFISLHADLLPEGHARGATIYRLAEEASDTASAKLAERHDRDDLLSGVDLTGKDDIIADVLMDLARMETRPRTTLLARALADKVGAAGVPLNSHPIRSAGFSVLKAPDIPSVLIETGFLSDDRDLANLADPAFRAKLAEAIRDAVQAWIVADAANAPLVRQ